MQIRVYYEDTDFGGVVYHANYLKYCERARSEVFFSHGLSPVIDNAHFVVKHIECDFVSPAYFQDILDVSVDVISIKGASFILSQEIKRDDDILFRANITLVLVKDKKVQRIKKEIKTKLLELFS